MEAHEKWIEAALKAWDNVPGMGAFYKVEHRHEAIIKDAIKLYLSASNQVLVPKEPSADMLADGMEVYFRNDDPEQDLWNIYQEMISAAPNPFKDK